MGKVMSRMPCLERVETSESLREDPRGGQDFATGRRVNYTGSDIPPVASGSRQDTATRHVVSREEAFKKIREKHAWLSRKFRRGIEDPNVQRFLDERLRCAEQSFGADNNRTLEELNNIIDEFDGQIDAAKMSRINADHQWLIQNALATSKDLIRYQDYLEKRWNRAQEAFIRNDNSALIDSVYNEFEKIKRDFMKKKYIKDARGVMRHQAKVGHLPLFPAEHYKDRGSRLPTIAEGSSERSSGRGSDHA